MKSLFGMLVAGLLMAGSVFAESTATFTEGKEYKLIKPPQATTTGDKVEVVELFWYGCPHCYSFEPFVKKWLPNKPANVEFVRLPAVLNPRWEVHARAFYTAQALGVEDKIHTALFDAMHKDKKRFNDEAALADFFVEQGVDREAFKKTFDSFSVVTKVNRARALTRRYGISGVPSVVINGKYRTSAQDAGSYPNILKVVDFLAAREANQEVAATP